MRLPRQPVEGRADEQDRPRQRALSEREVVMKKCKACQIKTEERRAALRERIKQFKIVNRIKEQLRKEEKK